MIFNIFQIVQYVRFCPKADIGQIPSPPSQQPRRFTPLNPYQTPNVIALARAHNFPYRPPTFYGELRACRFAFTTLGLAELDRTLNDEVLAFLNLEIQEHGSGYTQPHH